MGMELRLSGRKKRRTKGLAYSERELFDISILEDYTIKQEISSSGNN
mgnify:CR=1 FL=1